MAAPKAQAYEHAEIRVEDLGRAVAFYKDVMGLVELAREDGVVYLGCGFDENYDLAIREGGTGVVHFALRVEDEEALERYARRLGASGVGVERRDGTEPGQERGIRFTLPGGTEMELILVADNRYVETFRPAYRSSGIQPLDADHINLTSTDVKGLSQWLRDLLDVKLSDVIELDDQAWAAAWLRMSWAPPRHRCAAPLERCGEPAPRRLDVRQPRAHEDGRRRRRGVGHSTGARNKRRERTRRSRSASLWT